MKKVFEPFTKSIKDVSEEVRKSMTENSFRINKAVEKVINEPLEIMNDRGIKPSYSLSPLSKTTNPENTSQFKLVKDLNSNRVNDLLIFNTIPVILYSNS